MTVVNPPYVLQAATDHPASLFRRVIGAIVGEGVADYNSAGDLKVVPSSPAAMSIRVERGFGFVQGDDSTDQGVYGVYNDGYETVSIAAADATNPRKDLIVFSVNDNTEGQAGDTSLLEAITGTPAASPSEPALPDTALKLAVVDVPAAATSITSGNITDSRVAAGALISGAKTAQVATDQTTTATSFGDLSTVGPSVEVVTGPSGLAVVSLSALLTPGGNSGPLMGFAISGATVVAASLDYAFGPGNTAGFTSMRTGITFLVFGLIPGANVFTAKYRRSGGSSTVAFAERRISVVPL